VDAISRVDEIAERCRILGLDGFALCDHDTIDGLDEAKDAAGELVFVPGLEVKSRGTHIVCLDPKEVITPDLTMAETVDCIHDQGGTAILAHPCALPRSFVRLGQARGAGFDAVEVVNSAQYPFWLIKGWNSDLAERLGLPKTGGSDAHIPEVVGRGFTVVESESRDPRDVIAAIRAGRTETGGSGISWGERLSKFGRSRKKASS
jgi:predicted metal-dependent phosphoesterase TrpH